ncbi:hypothetical protein RND71_022449 [Anisodus tanguticus]|uniref:S-protein homolog n=1 Tax=Anisodus tanguticus TaxID=243964 RepID=A0AAE1RTB9_9SOLA|nr:hypothetical protein RND71_022449 [Anisodus tanguticus]
MQDRLSSFKDVLQRIPKLTNRGKQSLMLVHILNNLPENSPQLQLHCASKDNDFGNAYPPLRTDYKWEFCGWYRTLYFCHFWWGDKDTAFDVFNEMNYCVHDGYSFIPQGTKRCIWNVKADGIYMGYEDQSGQTIYKKYRDW